MVTPNCFIEVLFLRKTIKCLGRVRRYNYPEEMKEETIKRDRNSRLIILEFFYFKKYLEKTKYFLGAANAKGTWQTAIGSRVEARDTRLTGFALRQPLRSQANR